MNGYLVFILVALVGQYLLDRVADHLNIRHVKEELPAEFEGVYDRERYSLSQRYLRDNLRLDAIQSTVSLALLLTFLLLGGFNALDLMVRRCAENDILRGLLFTGALVLASRLIQLPFSVHDTFGLEERYGFNRTTPRTFILDRIKGILLGVLLGAPLLAAVMWFFQAAGPLGWLYAWIGVTAFQVALMYVAPRWILPIFNRYEPLPEGALRTAIEAYAQTQSLAMQGVFTMDGSRRSSKSNAFFTGFGQHRRIVLFDTTIERHSVPELVGVIAHETGHLELKHIPLGMVRSIAQTGLLLALVSIFITNPGLADAFQMEHVSVYAGLVFFGFLYGPIGFVLGVVDAYISRRHEFQADAFAARTTGDAAPLISALKKLSVDNLSDLTPHPMTVTLSYSHPPVLQRIAALRRL